MGWKVVMNEELTVHQEEGEVVDCPDEEEESSVVPETISDSCRFTSYEYMHYAADMQ